MLNYYISIHPIRKIKLNAKLSFTDLDCLDEDNYYNIIGKINNIELFKSKDNKDILSLTLEDETSTIKVRTYNDAKTIKENYKKGNIVYVNISKKGSYYYLNSINKLEG